jgi:hypothetical protein
MRDFPPPYVVQQRASDAASGRAFPAALDADRQLMLRTLARVLSDPSLSDEMKTAEVDATISAIRQIASLAGVTHG